MLVVNDKASFPRSRSQWVNRSQKKIVAGLIGLVVASAVLILAVPSLRAEAHWLWTTRQDGAGGYSEYLRTWPDGRHATEARALWDERGWQAASGADSVAAYGASLLDQPDGQYLEQARGRIDDLEWEGAAATNTVEAFEGYLGDHQDGKYVREARGGIEDLRWPSALATNTVDGFLSHLQAYPQGRYEAQARERIDDLRWQAATAADTVEGFERYLREEPQGKNRAQASDRIDDLRWGKGLTTSVGVLTIKAVEISDRVPPGCTGGPPGCSEVKPGYQLVIWLVSKDGWTANKLGDFIREALGSSRAEISTDFVAAIRSYAPSLSREREVYVIGDDGSRTAASAAGSFYRGCSTADGCGELEGTRTAASAAGSSYRVGSFYISFTPPTGARNFKLLWPGNPVTDLGK